LHVLSDTHELVLLIVSLETTMTKFGGGVDEFEFDLLDCVSAGLGDKTLSQGKDSFLGSSDTTLEHDPVFSDETIVGEASQRVNGFFR